jgi:hypothetical protein
MVWTGDAIAAFPSTDSFCIAVHLLGEIGLRPAMRFPLVAQLLME